MRPKKYPRLAGAIAEASMTHRELADLVGIFPGTIGSILIGETSPSAELRIRIAEVFGIDVDELFRPDPRARRVRPLTDDEITALRRLLPPVVMQDTADARTA